MSLCFFFKGLDRDEAEPAAKGYKKRERKVNVKKKKREKERKGLLYFYNTVDPSW